MKDKTKKIMAGVGIGLALAGSGMLMTGCTDIPVTQDQVNKVFESLDNANNFMSETTDIISNQNEKLDNLSNYLEDLNETLENQNQELTNIKNILSEEDQELLVETALKKYNYAINKLLLNIDDVWDNVIIGEQGSEGVINEVHIFRKSDDSRVGYFYNVNSVVGSQVTNYFYDTNGNVLCLDYDYKVIMLFQMYAKYDKELQLNKENVLECKVLENGNYFLTIVDEWQEENYSTPVVVDCEITQDGLLVSKHYYFMNDIGVQSLVLSNIDLGVYFKYNVLTETQVQANIDAYNAQNN